MITVLKNRRNKILIYASCIAFFGLMSVLHWNMSLDLSDDGIFKEVLKNQTLAQHISNLYFVTNGKIFPDSMAAIFTYLNPVIWKTVNIVILFIIAVCIQKLFVPSRSIALCLFAVFLLDFGLLPSAGYVATSANYVWTSAATLIALLPLKYADRFRRYLWMYPICMLAGIYAGNQELSGAVVVTVYTLYVGESLFAKTKICRYIWIQYGISVLSLIFLLTAPGHINRSSAYHKFCIPEYLTLDFFEKFIRGITSTASVIITGQTFIWPLFCFLLMLAVWIKNRNKFIRFVSLVPLAGSLILGNFQKYLLPEKIINRLSYYTSWSYSVPDYRYIDAITYTKWYSYIPLAAALILLGLVVLQILWAFGKTKKGIVLFLTFAAGFCTRITMGFSPTLYGSSFRTFIFLYIALGICIVMLLDEIMKSKDRVKVLLGIGAAGICAAFTYIGSLQSIL